MNKAGIYHRAKSNFAYAYDESTLHIRLRTVKDDIQTVSLFCADPYEWTLEDEETHSWAWARLPYEMTKEASTSLYDYWFISFKPPYRRLKYAFILNDGQEELLYLERGFFKLDDPSIKNDVNSYFAFPYMNKEDIFDAPKWVRDTVWYQIFPERFANGDSSNDPEGTLPWGKSDPTQKSFFGGDLQGILDKLDYLVDLGINGIYLTPIFEAPTNHKYDTINYFEIDKAFGDKALFKKLVDEAHARGIKIMLDAVFNHMGWYCKEWQDVVVNGEKSKYKDWFFINSFPVADELGQPILGSYETFGFSVNMPKINTNNVEAKKFLLDISTYWIKEFDIDAWRLDVANEIGHEFWRDFRKAVRAVKEDIYIVGETWHDSTPWLLGDQFDSVMNYPLTKAILEYVATDAIDSQTFIDTLVEATYRYPQNVNEVMFNLLDSHDTVRLLSIANNHKEKVLMCYTMLYSLAGSPCIFYGSEVGIDGAYDPLCRRCMVWDETQDLDYFAHIKTLINLRKTYPAISNDGKLDFILNSDNVIGYKKSTSKETIYFFFNNQACSKDISLPLDISNARVRDLYTFERFNTVDALTLQPYGFKILCVEE